MVKKNNMQTSTIKTIWITILAIIPASMCIISEAEHSALFAFVVLYFLDVITGLLKAHKTGIIITSHKLWRKTLGKGIPYIIAIGVFYIVSRLPIPFIDCSFCYLVCWLALTETYSNIENLACMGIKFPEKIVKRINKVLHCEDCE